VRKSLIINKGSIMPNNDSPADNEKQAQINKKLLGNETTKMNVAQ
jgi:hypothetical protein